MAHAKFPSTLSDADFLLVAHHEQHPLSGLKREQGHFI